MGQLGHCCGWINCTIVNVFAIAIHRSCFLCALCSVTPTLMTPWSLRLPASSKLTGACFLFLKSSWNWILSSFKGLQLQATKEIYERGTLCICASFNFVSVRNTTSWQRSGQRSTPCRRCRSGSAHWICGGKNERKLKFIEIVDSHSRELNRVSVLRSL